MPKETERGDPLGFFNIHSVAKLTKIKGGPLGKNIPGKKSRKAEKTKRGTLWSRSVLYVTRETFLVQFKRVQFGIFLKFNRSFEVELFWSLQVYRKKYFKKH